MSFGEDNRRGEIEHREDQNMPAQIQQAPKRFIFGRLANASIKIYCWLNAMRAPDPGGTQV
jgi:hypothetical protein